MSLLSAISKARQNHELLSLFAAGLLICYIAFIFILHPLRRYPGPFWAKVSDVPLVLQCRRARKSQWLLEQHKKYGPVVRIAPNHLSINSPEAIQQVYGHKTGFTKGPFYEAFTQVEPVLFNARNVHTHSRKRKVIGPAFSARNLQDFEEHMNPSVQLLVKSMETHAIKGETYNFCTWSNFLAFDIISEYSFGEPFGFLASGRDDYNLIKTVDARGEVFNALGHLPLWIRPYMKHFKLDSFWYDGLKGTSNLADIGIAAYGRRKNEPTSRKDLMSFLLNAKDPNTDGPLREAEIKAEAISFIVGGSDTTSSTMTHFMDFLSRDLKLQDDLWKELLQAFPGPLDSDWIATEEVAGKLPLLNALLKETMRLRPTSSTGLERVVPEGGRVVVEQTIPAGTLVSVPTVSIHHDPHLYSDPELFRPERWLEDSAKLNDTFIPFSIGPRACVGRNFAWMEMSKTLATIFRLFQFERTIKTPSPTREGFFVKVEECNVKIYIRKA